MPRCVATSTNGPRSSRTRTSRNSKAGFHVAWSEPLSLYCERTDASFWAEPVNALTNLAFLVAAAAACVAWRRSRARDPFALALIGVTFALGLGSFAFHTLAARGAVLLDVIPIAIFVYGYLLYGLRRIFHLAAGPALAILAAFAVASQGVSYALPAGALNGSGEYLPPLAALMAVGVAGRAAQQRPAGPAPAPGLPPAPFPRPRRPPGPPAFSLCTPP